MTIIKKRVLIITLLLITAVSVHAQDINNTGTPHQHGITSSGLGTAITIDGNAFSITSGTQKGGNLFHSFGKFNLHSGESAVFNDSGIENTVGRITGGEYSWINGKITSQAENLYLLNPAGVIFGADATLDLAGSFHVSTADYLRMGENEKFFAEPMENEILSVAAPTAFGFLEKKTSEVSETSEVSAQGLICFEGGEVNSTNSETSHNLEIPETSAGLHVKEGKIFSIIGGDIEIKGIYNQKQQTDENENSFPATGFIYLKRIAAPNGEIRIASMASAGEASLTHESASENKDNQGGTVKLSEGALLETDGNGGGQIFIRCGEFFMTDNSRISASTLGNEDSEGIRITASHLNMESSLIVAQSYGSGDAGDITILSDNAELLTGSVISNGTMDSASAGDINMMVSDTLIVKGRNPNEVVMPTGEVFKNLQSAISSSTFSGTGTAGQISVSADHLCVSQGGVIASASSSDGPGGDVIINVKDLEISDGGQITSSSGGKIGDTIFTGNGSAGMVKISATGDIHISGSDEFAHSAVLSATLGNGDGGNTEITANSLELRDGAVISSSSMGTGNAGNINITVERLNIQNSGIGTRTEDSQGGNITLKVADKMNMNHSIVTTSVRGGEGSGGNITIEEPDFVVLNHSDINANAYEGSGGNIHIISDQFIQSSDSTVEASSEKGIDGSINIESPITDISSSLMVLPVTCIDATKWMQIPCSARSGEDVSRFIIKRRDSVPNPLNDWLPGPLFWLNSYETENKTSD